MISARCPNILQWAIDVPKRCGDEVLELPGYLSIQAQSGLFLYVSTIRERGMSGYGLAELAGNYPMGGMAVIERSRSLMGSK